jgi:threonine/homoserine/homoserine lactone efflux protein
MGSRWSEFEILLWSIRTITLALGSATVLYLIAIAVWGLGSISTSWVVAFKIFSFISFFVLMFLLIRLTRAARQVKLEDRRRGFRTWLLAFTILAITMVTWLFSE